MKNDDEINESSISDLIHYAEDEKRNTFDDEPETDDELDNCCNRFYNDRYRNNRKLQK